MARDGGGEGAILIADNDDETRALVGAVLRQAGYETIEATSGDQAIDAARSALPRLVILEIALPGLSGYEVCHQLRNEFGEGLPIVFVSADRTEPFDRVAGFLVGADDYMIKPFAPDELLARVRRLARRTVPVAPAVASKLTNREMEVLRLLAGGLEQDEIARQLYITRKTVGTHLENLMRKLGVRSRSQAVALAYREALLKTMV